MYELYYYLLYFAVCSFHWFSINYFFTYLCSSIVFNEIEYFTYLNIWLVSLFFYIIVYFVFVNTSLFILSTVRPNDSWMELISTVCSLMFLLTIISPALLILLESDINIRASYIVQSLGYQWAWTFTLSTLGYTTYVDHYIISSSSIFSYFYPVYLFDVSAYLIFPIYSSIKIFVVSIDVIHSLGLYSFGIKIDAIPGRINLACTLRSLNKGEHRGFCFELCGQSHSTMLLCSLVVFYYLLFYLIFNYIFLTIIVLNEI